MFNNDISSSIVKRLEALSTHLTEDPTDLIQGYKLLAQMEKDGEDYERLSHLMTRVVSTHEGIEVPETNLEERVSLIYFRYAERNRGFKPIDEKEFRYRLAEKYVKSQKSLPRNLVKFFDLDTPDLIRLLKTAAEVSPGYVAQKIRSYAVEDLSERIEIAKICSRNHGEYTASYLKEFEIEDEKTVIDILKLCAETHGEAINGYLEYFNIQDKRELIEILKITLGKPTQFDLYKVPAILYKLNITEQQGLIELAEKCIEAHADIFGSYFNYFKILDEAARIKLAKKYAEKDQIGMTNYIEKFNITDKQALVEIFKLCAEKEGLCVARNIEKIEIESEEVRIQIAKLCAKSSGQEIAIYMNNFHIVNPQALFEIAKICLEKQTAFTSLSAHIDKFKITDEDDLFELARLCAESHPIEVCLHIKKFQIEDEHLRFVIACDCARFFPDTYKYISNFNIITTKFLEKIAECCVVKNTHKITEIINGLKIRDQDGWLSIYKAALRSSIDTFGNLPPYFSLTNPEKWKLLYTGQSIYVQSDFTRERIELIQTSFKEELNDLLDTRVNKYDILLFVRALFFISFLEESAQNWILNSGFLRAVIRFRRFDLMERVLIFLVDVAPLHSSFLEFKWNPKASWQPLTRILFAKLESLSVDKKVLENICQFIEKPSSKYQIYTWYTVLIEALINLTDTLPPDLSKILSSITEKTTHVELQAFNALSIFKKTHYLLETNSILLSLERVLNEKLEVENSAEKFLRTFGASRNPAAIATYFAKVESIENSPNALKVLKKFIIQVFEGTFEKERMNNWHLHQFPTDMVAKWGNRLTGNVGVATGPSESVNLKEWLQLKINEGHIPVHNYLERFLKGEPNVKSELGGLLKSSKSKGFDPLYFQKLLIEYAESEKKTTKEVQLILTRLIQMVENTEHLTFLNDLKGQLKSLTEFPVQEEGVEVFDTDNPIDLLLCGTEIYFSCQSIDGDAVLNIGLLGYLMHGWNRILKVSVGERGPILARCKIQLLMDGNKRPVLFRERFYSKGPLLNSYKEALNRLAKEKADSLGIPLLSLDKEGPFYGSALHAYGGPAPFEYSDAAGAGVLQKDGIYLIQHARYLIA